MLRAEQKNLKFIKEIEKEKEKSIIKGAKRGKIKDRVRNRKTEKMEY
jgi:hypothetical protein